MAKREIQTVGQLRDILESNGITKNTKLFFYYQSPEGAGLKSKTFEWDCTAICVESDDRGNIRLGFFSDRDPVMNEVTETSEGTLN